MKHLRTFNESIKRWIEDDIEKCFNELEQYLDIASKMLKVEVEDLPPEDAIIMLKKLNTDEANKLADIIDEILEEIAKIDVTIMSN